MTRTLALVLLVIVAGCSAQPPGPSGEGISWSGTITNEGDTTTVVNESGSVWGGPATLVEEASIGVDVGDDPYMFGDIGGIAALDGHLYVLDQAVPAVRVYDESGIHVRDIGRAGEGPGEFGTGFSGPVGIAFDEAGNLYVHARSKIEIFNVDGSLIDTWNLDRSRGRQGGVALIVPRPGLVMLAETMPCEDPIRSRCGTAVRAVEEGVLAEPAEPIPDLGYRQPDAAMEVRIQRSVSWLAAVPPFVPQRVWNVGPAGDVIVGRADRYEFERHDLDGTKTVVSRYWDPVEVQPDEAAWHLRLERLRYSREGATYVGTYDLGQGLPDHKPAFREFVPTHDGGLWLVRAGPGERLEGCAADTGDVRAMSATPCWRDTTIVDAFDAEGRYLGIVELPDAFDSRSFPLRMTSLEPFIDGEQVIAAIEDEAGTIMVKRYRLVVPGSVDR